MTAYKGVRYSSWCKIEIYYRSFIASSEGNFKHIIYKDVFFFYIFSDGVVF